MNNKSSRLKRLKVVIVGVENSGKTTLVRNLSPATKSIEHSDKQGNSITVGLDIGIVELAGYALHFFGTPGHERFEFARKIVSHGAHIGILVVDSEEATANGIGKRERDFEKELISKGLPYLICANKRDLPGLIPLSEIKTHFQADVLPIAAKTGQGIEELRSVLINLIEEKDEPWSLPRYA